MRKALRLSAFCSVAWIFVAAAGPARADWQQTHWGASLTLTLQALGGKAIAYGPGNEAGKNLFIGQICRAYIPSPEVGGFVFREGRLCFDGADHLTSVVLIGNGRDFYAIDQALHKSFGAPAEQENGSYILSRIWRDPSKGNALHLLLEVSDTVLEYSPLPSGF